MQREPSVHFYELQIEDAEPIAQVTSEPLNNEYVDIFHEAGYYQSTNGTYTRYPTEVTHAIQATLGRLNALEHMPQYTYRVLRRKKRECIMFLIAPEEKTYLFASWKTDGSPFIVREIDLKKRAITNYEITFGIITLCFVTILVSIGEYMLWTSNGGLSFSDPQANDPQLFIGGIFMVLSMIAILMFMDGRKTVQERVEATPPYPRSSPPKK